MALLGERPRCTHCGAALRRTHYSTGLCDPCQRRAAPLVVPAEFYDDPGLTAALARADFRSVFRAVRAEKHWSQQALAELLDTDQRTISRIETGRRPLTNLRVAVRVANKLGIPAGKLGFTHGVTLGTGASTGQKGSWVENRRDFAEQVAGLTFGAAGVDIHRLLSLFPQAEPTGTRRIGAADVQAIEQATAGFMRQDFAEGSGMVRDTAVAQLQATLPLLGAKVTDELRPRLYLATARLGTLAGYMSHDVTQEDAARRLWMIALGVVRATDHPLAADHTAFLLYDLALQAETLNRPDEALCLVHFGYGAAAGSEVSPATTSCLASIQARAHAAQGDTPGCERALGQAEDHFAAIDPTHESWAVDLLRDEAKLAGNQGSAYYTLALATGQPSTAARAVPLLRRAVDQLGPDRARGQALRLPDLAGAHALAGDVDTAVTLGHQAIDTITSVHSPRACRRLQVLHTALEPMHTSPGVTELRERLSATAA